MEVRLGKTEPTDLDANPEEIESVAVHEDVPKEEVVAETFGALKKRHRGVHLAVTCRGMTRREGVARRKETAGTMLYQEPRKDERTRRDDGWGPECNNGIRIQGSRQKVL
jgi:hypothetical protein